VTPAAFARDVAARCARIVEALAYGDTHFAIDAVADLEADAHRVAEGEADLDLVSRRAA
jgi:hypothetical protein